MFPVKSNVNKGLAFLVLMEQMDHFLFKFAYRLCGPVINACDGFDSKVTKPYQGFLSHSFCNDQASGNSLHPSFCILFCLWSAQFGQNMYLIYKPSQAPCVGVQGPGQQLGSSPRALASGWGPAPGPWPGAGVQLQGPGQRLGSRSGPSGGLRYWETCASQEHQTGFPC